MLSCTPTRKYSVVCDPQAFTVRSDSGVPFVGIYESDGVLLDEAFSYVAIHKIVPQYLEQF